MEDVSEVMTPLLLEMARLAIERHRPAQLAALRALRDVIADDERDREERFEASRQVLVLLSDMTGNRVWQMLARKTHGLPAVGADAAGTPRSAARSRPRRPAHGPLPGGDRRRPSRRCAGGAARRHRAPSARPACACAPANAIARSRDRDRRSSHDHRVHHRDADPGAGARDRDEGRLPVELRARGRGAAPPLREGDRGAVDRRARPRLGAARSITRFATTPLGAPMPIEQSSYWKSLPDERALGA